MPLSGPRRLRRPGSLIFGCALLGPPPSRRRFWLASADASREPCERASWCEPTSAATARSRCRSIGALRGSPAFPWVRGPPARIRLLRWRPHLPREEHRSTASENPCAGRPHVRIHAAFAQHRDAERDCCFRRPLCRPLNVRSRLRIVRARMRQGVFSSKFVQSRDEFVRIRLGEPLFRGGEAARSFWEGCSRSTLYNFARDLHKSELENLC